MHKRIDDYELCFAIVPLSELLGSSDEEDTCWAQIRLLFVKALCTAFSATPLDGVILEMLCGRDQIGKLRYK
jgi:hypothetical protein